MVSYSTNTSRSSVTLSHDYRLSPLALPFQPKHSSTKPKNPTNNEVRKLPPLETITIMHHNIQSITNKIPSIELFLHTLRQKNNLIPEVMCFTETWLTPSNNQCINFPGYTNVSSFIRPNRSGGGSSIFVKDTLDFTPLVINVDPIEFCFEFSAVKSRSLQLVVLCIYRSNNRCSDFDLFLKNLDLTLKNLFNMKFLIVCGDFNVDLVENSSQRTQLYTILNMFNMKVTVLSPTRITRDSSTC